MGDYLSPNAVVALWTVLVGAVANSACALLGCFLVLRKQSLLGDAISHAVLPGIAIAYFVTGQIQGLPILVGAMAIGILTSFLTHSLHGFGRVPEDASMGVVFTSLFAIGVILINAGANHVDLDPGCVLYGLIEYVPLDTTVLAGIEVPRALITLGMALAMTIGFVVLFWKELKIVSFDPALAGAMGVSVSIVHYLLMGMVAAVCVASFEAVGSILVVAMLIVPPVTARLLTDRLAPMLAWACIVAILSAISGYAIAVALNTSVAGMMSVCAGGLFAIALFFAPKNGFLPRAVRNLQLAIRISAEDLVAQLFRKSESSASGRPEPQLAGHSSWPKTWYERWVDRLAMQQLIGNGEIRATLSGDLELTAAGHERAEEIVRGHRLWEAYLGQHTELPLDHLHAGAERMEHYLSPGLQAALAAELQDPARDPHGRESPTKRTSDGNS
jgi:manganese/zinc/iron transport system permease protein